MTREEKLQIVAELSNKLSNCANFYIADSSGLSVAAINKFRGACYSNGLEFKLFKNSFIKKALEKNNVETTQFEEVLKGTSGIIFSPEVANAPAKVLNKFRNEGNKKPLFKAAYIDSDIYIGDEKLTMLSEIKSKEELIGDVIALLQSPAKNVISALQSGKNTLGGLIKTLSER